MPPAPKDVVEGPQHLTDMQRFGSTAKGLAAVQKTQAAFRPWPRSSCVPAKGGTGANRRCLLDTNCNLSSKIRSIGWDESDGGVMKEALHERAQWGGPRVGKSGA
jgi:hypothetical protein